MLPNNFMSASISLRPQISQKFLSKPCGELPIHPASFVFNFSSVHLSLQIPSLADVDSLSDRFRYGGRKTKFLSVVVPPVEITEKFADRVDPTLCLIDENAKQSSTLATLRDTLLPKMLSAELRAAEAANEVTSA